MKIQQIPITIYYAVFILSGAFYYYSFYPGYMSFDSSIQYAQVLSGEWSTISPVIMVALWTAADKIIPGPGGLFLFFIIIFLLGILLFTRYLRVNYWIKIIITLAIVFWPFNLMILPHLWKDVGLMSFLSLAIGLIQFYLSTGKYYSLFAALVTLIIASLFRFESIIYIAVMEIYVVVLLLRHFNQDKIIFKATSISLGVLCLGILLSQTVIKLSNSKKVILWPTIALWDLSRVSVKVNSILLPAFVIGTKMNVKDLSNAAVPWTNTHLFWKTKSGMNSGLETPYEDKQYTDLFAAWLSMIVNHPRAYLKHRFEVTNDLLRIQESTNKPISIFFSRKMYNHATEFNLNSSILNQNVTKFIRNYKDNIIFRGWFYLLLEILIVLFILVRKQVKNHEYIIVISISGVFSVMTLLFVSPSAEQRYLIWLFNSALFSIALLLQSNGMEKNKESYEKAS